MFMHANAIDIRLQCALVLICFDVPFLFSRTCAGITCRPSNPDDADTGPRTLTPIQIRSQETGHIQPSLVPTRWFFEVSRLFTGITGFCIFWQPSGQEATSLYKFHDFHA